MAPRIESTAIRFDHEAEFIADFIIGFVLGDADDVCRGLHANSTCHIEQHVDDLLGGTVAEQLAVVTLVVRYIVFFH